MTQRVLLWPALIDWGRFVLLVSVCLSACPSICLLKTPPVNLTFSCSSSNAQIWNEGTKAHLLSIRVCWYQGQGHLPRSRSNIKFTFLKKWLFWGISVSQTPYGLAIQKLVMLLSNSSEYRKIRVCIHQPFLSFSPRFCKFESYTIS